LLAAPYVTLTLEGRLNDADPWSRSLQLSPGGTAQFRLLVDVADEGTTNSLPSGTANDTINNLVGGGKDGVGGLWFDLAGANGANLTFSNPQIINGWDSIGAPPNSSPGTPEANLLRSIKIGAAPGTYNLADNSAALQGTIGVATGGTLSGVWRSNYTGTMRINSPDGGGTSPSQFFLTATMVNHASEPILVFAPLALSTGPGGDAPSLITIDGGTAPDAGGGNTRLFNLGNLLQGANVTTSYSLSNSGDLSGDVTVTSNSPALTTNWTNPTPIAGKATASNGNFSLNTGNAAVAVGSFSGTLTVDNQTNPNDANDVITVTANVGSALAADSGQQNRSAFVAANQLNAPVAANGSYAGLSSQTTRNIASGGKVLGTKAEILAGTNTGAATVVSMNWRTRATDETPGTATNPPINLAINKGLGADVVDLNGIATGQVYVFQMSYDETLFAAGEEARAAAAGQLYLVALNEINGRDTAAGTPDDLWVNAVDLNNGGSGSGANKQLVLGAWSNDLTVGHYGVDTTNNVVWAVMNRDLSFSVVPEPATFGLLGLAAAAFGLGRRRRA
jgi:hypothetical protein